MNDILNFLSELLGVSHDAAYRLVLTGVLIFLLGLIRFIILKIALRSTTDNANRYKWSKYTRYVMVIVGFLLVGRIWFEGVGTLATYLGLVSAGLVIVNKEPLLDIGGFLYIMWRHPFRLGDRIEVNEVKGDVIDQGLFKFTLMEIGNWIDAEQSTGRIVHIPNHKALLGNIFNYTGGFKYIWDEVPVRITFESNHKKAKKLLLEIASRHSVDVSSKAEKGVVEAATNYYINFSKLTATVYTEIKDYGVCLTLRYLSEPRKRRLTRQEIHEEILEMLNNNNDIIWAYPTSRVYRSEIDGKDENWLGAGVKVSN